MLRLIEQIANEEVANNIRKWTEKQGEGIREKIFGILEKHSISKEIRDTLFAMHVVLHVKSFEIGKDTTFIKQLSDVLRPDDLKAIEERLQELNKVVIQFRSDFTEKLDTLNLTPDDKFEIQSLLFIYDEFSFNEGVIQSIINSKWPRRNDHSGPPIGGW
jgi:hypothetical protein